MSLIKARNLIYEYIRRDEEGNVEGITRAVDDVSLDVSPGQFIAILGHNGSGKSTLAKHFNALINPEEGTLLVDGLDAREEDNVFDVRQSVGMVFQNPDNQIIGQVVEEDVGFGPENLGIEHDEIWERVISSLKAVNMYDFKDFSPNKLSGGQKQRVSIAGIMAMRPKCIVLDEPTAMLDPIGRKDVLDAISELNKKNNISIILITHNMEEAVLADKIFVMNKGKIEMSGSPREIFSQVDKLRKLRLDVPPATIIAHMLREKGVNIPEDILTREELVESLTKLNNR